MHDAEIVEGIELKFNSLVGDLDERGKRRWAAVEAMALGRGVPARRLSPALRWECKPPCKPGVRGTTVLLSLRSVLAYRYGWTTNELAKRHLAFEFSGVAETDKNLLLNTLLIGEFMSRIARGVSNQRMNLWICCDEAARLVSSTDTSISEWIGLIRGTGIGLDLSVQSAQLASSILSNMPNKFIGRCASATDYDQMGSAIGLTTEQRRWLATHLVPGLFLGSLGQGSWRWPFLFRIPSFDLNAT